MKQAEKQRIGFVKKLKEKMKLIEQKIEDYATAHHSADMDSAKWFARQENLLNQSVIEMRAILQFASFLPLKGTRELVMARKSALEHILKIEKRAKTKGLDK